MKYHFTYIDGSEHEYETLQQAEEGIREIVTGCDFAVTVNEVFAIDSGKRLVFGCSWSVILKRL